MDAIPKYVLFAAVLFFSVNLAKLDNPFIFVKFTNVVCESLDNETLIFDKCALKAFNRKINYLTIAYHFKRPPMNNYSVHFSFKYKANGWKPFLYDMKINICQFTRRRNNPVAKIFFDFIAKYVKTYTCPVTEKFHDLSNITNIHVANMVLLPVPPGEYATFSTWYSNNAPHARVDVFSRVSDSA